MEGIITDYFTDIFTSSQPSGSMIDRVCSTVTARLPSNMVSFLSKDFSIEEIRTALFQMNPSKAPGFDGFPTDFFQRFWDIVG